jgi:hypothetical protein
MIRRAYPRLFTEKCDSVFKVALDLAEHLAKLAA